MIRVGQLSILTAFNILLVALTQWYPFIQLGVGAEIDALIASMTVPQLLLAIVSTSLTHVLVPLFTNIKDPGAFRLEVWRFLLIIGIFFGVIGLALGVTITRWVPIIVPGFDDHAQLLMIDVSRLQLLVMVLMAVSTVQSAAHHSRGDFIKVELTSIVSNTLALILLVLLLPRFGVTGAGWAMIARGFLQAIMLMPGLGRPIWHGLPSETVATAWCRIRPLLLGTAYYKTDPMVDRFLLSSASEGSLALYYLAQQIYGIAAQWINQTLANPVVLQLSELNADGRRGNFWKLFQKKILIIFGISLVGYTLLLVVGKQILSMLLLSGRIDASSISELWWIMVLLGGLFVGGTMGRISSIVFYVQGRTNSLTRISMCSFTAYVPFKILLFHLFGVMGLAVATSIYFLLDLMIQLWVLKVYRSTS